MLYFLNLRKVSVFKVGHLNILAAKSGFVVDDKCDKAGQRDDHHQADKSQHAHCIGEATEVRCRWVGVIFI